MLFEDSNFLSEMPVQETAVPAWQSPEYSAVCQELIALLPERLHVSETEAAYVARTLVMLSAWRDEIDALARKLAELEGEERCNGRVEERNDGIWYARHGPGVSCPLHGEPKEKRWAKYVGKQPEKQAAVAKAMTQQSDYERIELALTRAGGRVAWVSERLTDLYRRVGGMK